MRALTLAVLMLVLAACGSEPAGLSRPNLLCAAPDGRLYVSDFHHQRIVAFDTDGVVSETFGDQGLGVGQLWQVRGLACDAGGVWVTQERITSDEDNTQVWEVKRFQGGSETSAHRLTYPGGKIKWIGAIAPGEDGAWFAVDEERSQLLLYDRTFAFQQSWARPAGGPPFKGPTNVKRRGDDLWVVEQYSHRIRRMTIEGEQLAIFGTEGRAPGQLRFPSSLDVCAREGWLAVADFGNYRVQRFRLDGSYIDGFEPDPVSPDAQAQLMDIIVSPDCRKLYLADSKGNRVIVTSPQGTGTTRYLRGL